MGNNDIVINGLCEQLKLIYERIAHMTSLTNTLAVANRPDILEKNYEMIAEELEQAQKLTLALTREIIGVDESADASSQMPLGNYDNDGEGSAFSNGELTERLGGKNPEIENKFNGSSGTGLSAHKNGGAAR